MSVRFRAGRSDAIKLAFAEAGAVKPLVKLLRSGSASGKEEAEGVLWTLLAMNREASGAVRMSVEAAADMVLLLGTTEALAKEAAGVIANMVPHNRTTLMQAGAVEGLMQVRQSAICPTTNLSDNTRGLRLPGCQDDESHAYA